MFDVSTSFKKFYYNHVVLSKSETDNLREKKKLNLDRLVVGLNEYNDEKNTNYKVAETLEQGSVAMSTVTQSEDKDYDIDVAVIFDSSNIGDIGPRAIKNVIVDALKRKCTNFKTEPEAKTNCVRIVYADNYHIDFAIYKRIKQEDGSYKYEHAGSEWRSRDPRAINNWFKSEIKEYGEKLRQAVRLSKMFCKSRESWQMPAGLIQSVLCDEKIQEYSRMDEMFYYTMKEVQKRLSSNKEVTNPTDEEQSLLLKQTDKDKVNNLCNRLEEKLGNLEVLFDDNCTEKKAKDAWKEFFNHNFWESTASNRALNEACSYSIFNEYRVNYNDTEEFIENIMPMDLKYEVQLECVVEQDGWRTQLLSNILKKKDILRRRKKLDFYINYTNVPKPYDIYWKIKNEGEVALKRNMIRGQIVKTNSEHHKESTDFKGEHYVECYIIKNSICVAIGRIEVPIGEQV